MPLLQRTVKTILRRLLRLRSYSKNTLQLHEEFQHRPASTKRKFRPEKELILCRWETQSDLALCQDSPKSICRRCEWRLTVCCSVIIQKICEHLFRVTCHDDLIHFKPPATMRRININCYSQFNMLQYLKAFKSEFIAQLIKLSFSCFKNYFTKVCSASKFNEIS